MIAAYLTKTSIPTSNNDTVKVEPLLVYAHSAWGAQRIAEEYWARLTGLESNCDEDPVNLSEIFE